MTVFRFIFVNDISNGYLKAVKFNTLLDRFLVVVIYWPKDFLDRSWKLLNGI